MQFLGVVTCSECKHHGQCGISKGEDWYCGDGVALTNTVTDMDVESYLDKLVSEVNDQSEYKTLIGKDFDIPPACRNCSNHPINGGSGICHCTLGSQIIF